MAININDLKNENTTTSTVFVDPNLKRQIDDNADQRGSFDPAANGFANDSNNPLIPDEPMGMDKIDQDLMAALEQKKAEIAEFNDMVEMTGGELTEDDIKDADTEYLTALDKNDNSSVNMDEHTDPVKYHETIEDDLDEDNIQPAPVANNKVAEINVNKESITFIDDEDAELEDELNGDNDKEADERTEKLKAAIKGKIKPVAEALDLNSFTITNKPVALSSTLNNTMASTVRTADWALYASGVPVTMKSFTGTEISKLNDTSGKTRYNAVKDQYGMIFDHIVDRGDKPKTVEEWAKTISFLDIENLWFAVYRACFEGANYLPYTCGSCNEIFLSDSTPIMDMVKFTNDEARAKFNIILNTETNPHPNLITSEMVQVSDNYAFTFREPTIYNMIFESAVLDKEFTDKYSDLIALIVYIEDIYYINRETMQLQPITHKVFPNNLAKTTKAKIIQFSKIIQTLNSDQYSSIMAYIQQINSKGDDISYVIPEATCPKCGSVINEQSYRATDLVFTRHQLATLAAL